MSFEVKPKKNLERAETSADRRSCASNELTRRDFMVATSVVLASSAVFGKNSDNALASDRHRPRYHLMPPSAWLNDPNGPLFWKGQYHLFYQYASTVSNTATKHWAHAVSTDLVHWKNLGIALSPTPGGPDKNGCWSGSAVVANGVPTLVYTGGTWETETERAAREKGINPERQLVAVAADPSDPHLRKWNKIPQNPVLSDPPAGIKTTGWRDPSLWKEADAWYMVIGSGEQGKGGMALLYRTDDLRKFDYLHPLAIAKPNPDAQGAMARFSMWECPEFFFLDGKPILLVAAGNRYLTGTYSEKDHLFHQENEGVIDCGRIAYAQKTMEDDKKRRIWWGWIREKRSQKAQEQAGWAGVMSLSRVLTLRNDGMLGVEPVPELKQLRGKSTKLANQKIDDKTPLLLKGFASDCAELEAEIDPGNAQEVGLRVRSTADGSEQTLIGFNREKQTLFCDTTNSSNDPETKNLPRFGNLSLQEGSLKLDKGETFKLRLYIDASVLEIFANGSVSLSDRVYPSNPDSLGIGLFAKGGSAHLKSLTLWELKPISPDRMTSGAELFKV